jgi:hypothetical protein
MSTGCYFRTWNCLDEVREKAEVEHNARPKGGLVLLNSKNCNQRSRFLMEVEVDGL